MGLPKLYQLIYTRLLSGFEKCFKKNVSFDRFKNCGAIDVKMDGSVLDKESSFKVRLSPSKNTCFIYFNAL